MGLNSRYEIRVRGTLDRRWSTWFEGLQVTSDEDQTVIARPVADQAALHGPIRAAALAVVPGLLMHGRSAPVAAEPAGPGSTTAQPGSAVGIPS